MKLKRMMIAAPKSGSGKTTLTCALIQALKDQGAQVVSYKCGPDYIDPMFHKKVLGIPSKNLDTFFTEEEQTKELFLKDRTGNEFVVMEGVMGLFDGLGGYREEGSSYHLAKITRTPILLVVDAKGMGYSVLPLLAGFLQYDKEHLIQGVLLNRMSKEYFEIIAPKIEEELHLSVVGYFPNCKELHLESRHLGLVMPQEMDQLQSQLEKATAQLVASVDLGKIYAIAQGAEEIFGKKATERQGEEGGRKRTAEISNTKNRVCPRIAVALDEAFCFYYEDNLAMIQEEGAILVPFSPLHDRTVPEDCDGILLGGGYPELYAKGLSENIDMKASLREAISKKMPLVAECGGFLYLHETITDADGSSYSMVGAMNGDCNYTGKLVRFGYVEIQGSLQDEWLGGQSIKAHEFHYFDSTNNGIYCTATKPTTGRQYPCIQANAHLWAGFPHLYYPSNKTFPKTFVAKAWDYHQEKRKKRS